MTASITISRSGGMYVARQGGLLGTAVAQAARVYKGSRKQFAGWQVRTIDGAVTGALVPPSAGAYAAMDALRDFARLAIQ